MAIPLHVQLHDIHTDAGSVIGVGKWAGVIFRLAAKWGANLAVRIACPESRFVYLMFHGIHPVEDCEADKLLRSSMYQGGIVRSELQELDRECGSVIEP